jgi:hypothetical protein
MPPSMSLLDDLGLVLGQVSPALVPAEARARIMRFAARVPSMDGGFEVRLHDPHAPIDISVCATPAVASDIRILAGVEPGHALPPVLADHPAWRQAASLARDMLARGGGQPPATEVLWLEFDDPVLDDEAPTPCLMLQRHPSGDLDLAADAIASHRLLLGEEPPPSTMAALAALRAAMPPGVTLPNLGVMIGRPGLPVRLRLHGWPPALLADTLGAIWGDATAKRLRQGAAVLAGLAPVPPVTLDIHPDRPPKIGLPMPCWIGPGAPAAAMALFDGILGLLVGKGLCLPAMADGLRAWPGWVHDARPVTGLPHRRQTADAIPVLSRTIVQFKLGFEADGALRAKAYFGILRRCVPKPGG